MHQPTRKQILLTGSSCLALPFLESFSEKKESSLPTKKMIFIGTGFGFTKETFFPTKAGKFSEIGLTEGLSPLERYKNEVTMVSHLTNLGAIDPHGGSTSYLTGANVSGTPGKRFFNSISCDQLAAKHLGTNTRYRSLVLTADKDTKVGSFGHGKGTSLSWDQDGKPIPGIDNPLKLYQKLFSAEEETPEQIEQRLAKKQSILDIVGLNATAIKTKLSKVDQNQLEQYFQSLRQIELDLALEAKWSKVPKPTTNLPAPDKKLFGIDQVKKMFDLLAIGLQNNSTHVASYRLPVDSIIQSMGIKVSGHNLSHYHKHEQRTIDSKKRDKQLTELFAYFIDRLKEKSLNHQSLFDHCIVSFGSNLRSSHDLKNLPCLLTGGGIANLRRGEHIMLKKHDTPLANLWLTLIQESGVNLTKFSHSNGRIDEILT
jgi:hypothetical protein